MYYYYHPESNSLWCQKKEDSCTDGHIEELTEQEAFDMARHLGLKEIPEYDK